MRSHANASPGGLEPGRGTALGRIIRAALAIGRGKVDVAGRGAPRTKGLVLGAAAFALALAVAAIPAGATQTHLLKGVFGTAEQPAFPADRGLAVDASGDLHVIDSTQDVLHRFKPDGTPSDFSALGSNSIDGVGPGDETPQGHLAFSADRQREQVAIDRSGTETDGNIYVTQSAADVVDIFSADGEYLGQLTESSDAGAFGEPCGVAVDDNGTVYVGDRGDDLIHVFEPSANPPVNADNMASFNTLTDPCTLAAGAAATSGYLFVNTSSGAQLSKLDATTGEVEYPITTGASTVTVDPANGHVYVARNTGAASEVAKYDASGAAEAISISAVKPGSTVEGVAVADGGDDIFVSRASTENIEVYGPTVTLPEVTTTAPATNTGTRATLAGTVNPDGQELDECFFEWGVNTTPDSYGSIVPCSQSPAEIGAGTSPVAVTANISGLVPQGGSYEYRLVARNPNGTVHGQNQVFTTPNTVLTTPATPITGEEATLRGTVNPDTTSISGCVFEWGIEKDPEEFSQTYPNTAPCVPGPAGITGTDPVAVSATIGDLDPGTVYHYRLKATYPTGSITSSPTTVQTLGPRIAATWSEDVIYEEATLKAEIDPEGKSTTYRFEWGTTTAYGNVSEEKGVGSGSSVVEVALALDQLEPDTRYHYRVVAANGDAETIGPDRTLETYQVGAVDTDCPNQAFRVGPSALLPDCRAYEMVTPIEKNGGDIVTRGGVYRVPSLRASFNKSDLSGDKITYSSVTSFGDQPSGLGSNQYLASRDEDTGWSSHGINAPQGTPYYAGPTLNLVAVADMLLETRFKAFSDDLSTAWIVDANRVPITPDANFDMANLYKRDNTADGYQAITTAQPSVVPGSPFEKALALEFRGFSEDGKRAVFVARAAMTPDAAPNANRQVYMHSDGQLHLVSILPNGAPDPGESIVGGGSTGTTGLAPQYRYNRVHQAVSDDGSRVFWTAGTIGSTGGHVYVRINPDQEQSAIENGECVEPEKACTVPVSQTVSDTGAHFWAASADGSVAVFSIGSNLYEVDVDAQSAEHIAGGLKGVIGASEDDDLSHLYFSSTEALTDDAVAGEHNLYLRRQDGVRFIATLAELDVMGDDRSVPGAGTPVAYEHNAHVTPDGRHLAFMSIRSLTGYDNTDLGEVPGNAINGKAAAEVFHYAADTDTLTCASCKPSGARPRGGAMPIPYVSRASDNQTTYVSGAQVWVAAWLPVREHELHSARVLSHDGERLFFNSLDALVPQDTNGVQDVYQWERQGSGTCQRPGGCISLISTGTSAARSEFVDADEKGNNVFFETNSSIHPGDPGLVDIYVARVNGGQAQQVVPASCEGEACQGPPSPPDDPTPGSSSFSGVGNLAERRAKARRPSCSKRQVRRGGRCVAKRAIARRRCAKRKGRSKRRCVRTQVRRLSAGATGQARTTNEAGRAGR